MKRSILSRVNTCYPNNWSGSKTGPFVPSGQFPLGSSKIVSAPAIQAQGRISIVASPITAVFEEDKSYRLHGESHNLHISEGSTPKPSGSRRINSRTSGAQEEISVIAGFQEYTSKITKGKDLRPAKRTINFRTTRPTKFLLPRSCPLDLQGITNGSTEATRAISTTAHIQSTSGVVHLWRT
ncbi:hypothetical protein YC2023_011079 [Brassica napus]